MIDLSKIPDDVFFKEAARRMAKQPGAGRQKVMRPCPKCGEPYGARKMREHIPQCKGQLTTDAVTTQ
jgi:hypothetical protein